MFKQETEEEAGAVEVVEAAEAAAVYGPEGETLEGFRVEGEILAGIDGEVITVN